MLSILAKRLFTLNLTMNLFVKKENTTTYNNTTTYE